VALLASKSLFTVAGTAAALEKIRTAFPFHPIHPSGQAGYQRERNLGLSALDGQAIYSLRSGRDFCGEVDVRDFSVILEGFSMLGLMNDRPLLVSNLMEHAARNHGSTEIVSLLVQGGTHRYTFADCEKRSKKLANALIRRGVGFGDRVATLAWNGYRHLEAWYAISGMGAVTHTINPRLFPEQIVYIINHAEDKFILVDLSFVPLLEKIAAEIKGVKAFIILADEAQMPETSLKNLICYESLIAGESEDYTWPEFDERTASSLCYTSGTTGHPKGVLYSHRSTILHCYGTIMTDTFALSALDVAMPVVPMFHANAWGMPYAAFAVGAKMVFPGPHMDGRSIHSLITSEKVTVSAGVPTVWQGLLHHLETSGGNLGSLNRVVIGGAAVARSMIKVCREKYGIRVIHAWGMTETSPLGTIGALKASQVDLPVEKQIDIQALQGRAIFGVELKITDDNEQELPRDGVAFGHLKVRGPWVAREYFKHEGGKIVDAEGWFDTGDVATLNEDGFIHITDRSKDVIKSGGEWISSIDLENAATGHPAVAEAAVIGVHHPKWDERPLLIVVKKPGTSLDYHDMIEFLKDKVAKWWLPDDVVFVDELPHTATGKLLKTALREQFKDFQLRTVH
jgi:acyl-CoA synthetase (AMP-forming)/AMP-acid ligase II